MFSTEAVFLANILICDWLSSQKLNQHVGLWYKEMLQRPLNAVSTGAREKSKMPEFGDRTEAAIHNEPQLIM